MTTLQELQGMSLLEQAKIIYAEGMGIFSDRLDAIDRETEHITDPTARDMARRDRTEEVINGTALPSALILVELMRAMSPADRYRFKAYQYEHMAEEIEAAERDRKHAGEEGR